MRRAAIAAIAILAAASAHGQRADTLHLTIEAATARALERSHAVETARLNRRIADERVTEAWGGALYPTVTGTASYRRALKRGVFNLEIPALGPGMPAVSRAVPMGKLNTASVGATLEQTIYSGAAFAGVRAAEIFERLSDESLEASRASAALETKRAYYAALLARQLVELNEASLRLAEENLANARSMREAGMIPEYEFRRASSRVAALKPEATAARNNYETALARLKLAIDLDPDAPVRLVDSLAYNERETLSIDELRERMLDRNPTLRQAALQIRLNEENVNVQRSGHFPTVSASASWTAEAQEDDDKDVLDWRYNNSVYVGVNARVPIFNGLQTTARTEKARLEKRIAEENRDNAVRQYLITLEETVASIERLEELIEGYRESVEQARLAYEAAASRFRNGVGAQVEVVEASLALSQARVGYHEAIFNYNVAGATLELLLGTPPGEMMER
ncbi:MAG: hypothetical protein GF419_13720 [Ignavibacteriales bacterium]|nr:hypothetical protein [Ignavibacteriales bacterium]